MTPEACARCGQLLLPELVREVGGGTTCPFCSAPVKAKPSALAASVAAGPTKPPASPPAPGLSAARVTILGHGASVPTPKRAPPSPAPPSDDGNDWFRGSEGAARKTSARKAPEPPPAPAIPEPPKTVPPTPRPAAKITLVGTPPPALPAVLAPAPSPPAAVPARAPIPAPVPAATPAPVPAAVPVPVAAPSSARYASALVAQTEQMEAIDWDAPDKKRRRALAAGVVVVVTVALLVGIGARRRGKPAAPAPRPMEAVAPTKAAPPPPPAPPTEIGLDPGGTPAPVEAAPAPPPAEPAPRARVVREHPAHEPSHPHAVRRRHEKHERSVALKSSRAPATSDHGAAHAAYLRGNTALLAGDPGGAVAAYREAVHLAPDDPAGYRGLGLAFEKQGKLDDAAAALRRYLKLAPRSRDRDLVARRLQHLTHPSADDAR